MKRHMEHLSLRVLTFIIAMGLCFSCDSEEELFLEIEPETSSFIYVSHTRLDTNDGIYAPVYDIDFSHFDMTLLGGDLAASSFADEAIKNELDSVFDLKRPQTLWSPGNHDGATVNQWEEATLKNKYHAYSDYDVTFITLDSQDSLSSIVGEQKDFLLQTLDTLQTSSVLIMTHKLIFMVDHPVMDSQIATVCNAGKGDCYHCHNENNFYDDIYDKILEVKNRGVEVLWVGGDLGFKTAEFQYIDDNGIIFLGNGIGFNREWNKVLLFKKQFNSPISYEFVSTDLITQINSY